MMPPDVAPAGDPAVPPAPPADLPWLQPYPDRLLAPADDEPGAVVVARETIELAFIAAIQHLPPRQRAVLILRDVLGWSAKDTATLLDVSVVAANSALQRARATLRDRLGERRSEWAPSSEPSQDERELLRRYVDAHERADADALAALLREDVRLTMPPHPVWYDGREAVVIAVPPGIRPRVRPPPSRRRGGQPPARRRLLPAPAGRIGVPRAGARRAPDRRRPRRGDHLVRASRAVPGVRAPGPPMSFRRAARCRRHENSRHQHVPVARRSHAGARAAPRRTRPAASRWAAGPSTTSTTRCSRGSAAPLPTSCCSAAAPTRSSPPTGRTTKARSPTTSTAPASTSPRRRCERLEWNNSTLITGDVAEYVGEAQARGRARDPGPRQPGPDPDAAQARPDRRAPPVDLPGRGRAAASACSATARSPPP